MGLFGVIYGVVKWALFTPVAEKGTTSSDSAHDKASKGTDQVVETPAPLSHSKAGTAVGRRHVRVGAELQPVQEVEEPGDAVGYPVSQAQKSSLGNSTASPSEEEKLHVLHAIDVLSSKFAKKIVISSSKKQVGQCIGTATEIYDDHSPDAARKKRLQVGKVQIERSMARLNTEITQNKRQLELLQKVIKLCEEGQRPDKALCAELQSHGVHPDTIRQIGGHVPLVAHGVEDRSVADIATDIEGGTQKLSAKKVQKLASCTGRVTAPPGTDVGVGTADDDQDNDEIWECTEDYMAEILHPYILTSPNPTPQLACLKRGPTFERCYQLCRKAWEALKEELVVEAKEFVEANNRNYDDTHKTKQYLLFRQRAGREKFKIDLHTAQAQRDAGRCMTALQASAAAMAYLQILHHNMVSWIPGQEVTLVTGQGLSTGCRQFVAVGLMLPVLQKQGVIRHFYPVSDSGAYRVFLALPNCPQNA